MTVGGVAVIGAAGHLGSAVCEAVAADAPVRRLVRTDERPGDERYDFWRDDLGSALAGAPRGVDAVVFTARVHPVSQVDDSATMREYAERIRRVVKACAGRLLLVVSTDAVFSGDCGRYTEEQTPEPSTAYGRCARLIEEVVADEAERWCIVRPSYIYGVAPSGPTSALLVRSAPPRRARRWTSIRTCSGARLQSATWPPQSESLSCATFRESSTLAALAREVRGDHIEATARVAPTSLAA